MRFGDALREARKLPLPFWVMFADTFVMAVGFYMLVPLLAFHLLENLAFTAAAVGAIAAVRSASQQGLMVWSGSLADRIGYRRAICVGVLARAAGFTLFAFADSVAGFVAGSVLAGFGGSLFHPASYATYGVLTSPSNRVTIYSVREMLSNVGFVLGPLLGGVLLAVDFRWICLISAGLFAGTAVLTRVGLPHLVPAGREHRTLRASIKAVASNREFVRLTWAMAGAWVLVAQLYLAVPVRARTVLPESLGIGTVYAAGAVVMVVLMVPLSRTASKRLAPMHVMALGTCCLAAGLAILGLVPVAAGLYGGVMVFTIGQVLCQPMMNTLVSRYSREGQMASYFGVNGLSLAVGGLVGNLGGGMLYQVAQRPGLLLVPWIVFAVWGCGVALLFVRRASHSRS